MATRLSIVIFFFVGSLASVHSECKVPPQFWCDNPQISADCGVTEQCRSLQRSNSNKPVDFTLYYESLCPDCKNFFAGELNTAFQKLGGNIMNLTIVPFGNAMEKYDDTSKEWKYSCQHGKQECLGNIIETCAINLYHNITVYFPFISCMEKSTQMPEAAGQECASNFKLNWDSILACSKSAKGNAWEHQMALKTNALRPSHQYVPWVTLNGVHTDNIQNKAQSNLIKLICDTYTGPSKPAACSQ